MASEPTLSPLKSNFQQPGKKDTRLFAALPSGALPGKWIKMPRRGPGSTSRYRNPSFLRKSEPFHGKACCARLFYMEISALAIRSLQRIARRVLELLETWRTARRKREKDIEDLKSRRIYYLVASNFLYFVHVDCHACFQRNLSEATRTTVPNVLC